MMDPAVDLALKMRTLILQQSYRAEVGHIGSCLCIVDILAALYGTVLNVPAPDHPERDRFVLSKGHAALALYTALHLKGWLTETQLNTFCTDGAILGTHPENHIPGVDYSTGSLGQGLSYGVGAALAAQRQGSSRKVYVLMSDAECNEGSVWEAIMFAAHHRLSNLVVIIDSNHQQALGCTEDIIHLSPLAPLWRAFNWHAVEADGHDIAGLVQLLQSIPIESDKPHVIVAETIFGKGVSFMEKQLRWHYVPMKPEEYQQALAEVLAQKEAY